MLNGIHEYFFLYELDKCSLDFIFLSLNQTFQFDLIFTKNFTYYMVEYECFLQQKIYLSTFINCGKNLSLIKFQHSPHPWMWKTNYSNISDTRASPIINHHLHSCATFLLHLQSFYFNINLRSESWNYTRIICITTNGSFQMFIIFPILVYNFSFIDNIYWLIYW